MKIESIATAPGASVTFRTLATKTYSVEYTDAPDSGLWVRLGAVPARPGDRFETLPDPNWTTNRFYRLATPYAPAP